MLACKNPLRVVFKIVYPKKVEFFIFKFFYLCNNITLLTKKYGITI